MTDGQCCGRWRLATFRQLVTRAEPRFQREWVLGMFVALRPCAAEQGRNSSAAAAEQELKLRRAAASESVRKQHHGSKQNQDGLFNQ